MPSKVLKINDVVSYRDSWGGGEIETVKITSLDVTKEPNEKYGEEVQEVEWHLIEENRVVVGVDKLSGGMEKWAYSYQIAPKGQDPRMFHQSPLYRQGWY